MGISAWLLFPFPSWENQPLGVNASAVPELNPVLSSTRPELRKQIVSWLNGDTAFPQLCSTKELAAHSELRAWAAKQRQEDLELKVPQDLLMPCASTTTIAEYKKASAAFDIGAKKIFYRRISLRRVVYVGWAVGIWAAFCAFTLALGWTVRWVYRGFVG